MSVAETSPNAAGEQVRVFDEMPELLEQLSDGDAAALSHITARVISLPMGAWRFDFREQELHGHLGLLVLDGLVTRHVAVGEATCAELLGTGDLLRPWTEGGWVLHGQPPPELHELRSQVAARDATISAPMNSPTL